jgi:hypothetical protein
MPKPDGIRPNSANANKVPLPFTLSHIDAGIVDEDVKTAFGGARLLDMFGCGRRVADVEFEKMR